MGTFFPSTVPSPQVLDGARSLVACASEPSSFASPATSRPAPRMDKPSRHRRVHKEVGAKTGVTFIDHPKGNGVVVSELTKDGACLSSGVRVGDHIVKINGEKPNNRAEAVKLCDAAWTAEVDGSKNNDRLKFSLHHRTQDFEIEGIRTSTSTSGLSAGALIGVESMNSGGRRMSASLFGGKKLEETGLSLEDSPAGFGALITDVEPDSPADVAGLEVGLTIASVDGTLCPAGASAVSKLIEATRSKKGSASLVCHLKKSSDENEHV